MWSTINRIRRTAPFFFWTVTIFACAIGIAAYRGDLQRDPLGTLVSSFLLSIFLGGASVVELLLVNKWGRPR